MNKKKKDDRLGSDPFESVLPFIQDSRKKKEADNNSDSTSTKNTDSDIYSSTDNSDTSDVDNSRDVITDVNNVSDSDSDIIVDNVSDSVNVDDIDAVSVNDAVNINDSEAAVANDVDSVCDTDNAVGSTSDSYVVSDKITIPKKKNKAGAYSRMTFYLRPDQVRFINRLHKDSGRDKSELIRMAVDILIERARVE